MLSGQQNKITSENDMAELEFYCCDCHNVFVSQPDGTGFEQAPCPQCSLICMTSEFEGKSTKKDDRKVRKVIVAEFETLLQAEALCERLSEAGIEPEVHSPDFGADDFFGGGSGLYGVRVPTDDAAAARAIIDATEEA